VTTIPMQPDDASIPASAQVPSRVGLATEALRSDAAPGAVRHLMDLRATLSSAVNALEAVGADGFADVYLYVAATRGERAFTEVAIEDGRLWMQAPDATTASVLPRFVTADEDGLNRRALLIGAMCFAVSTWRIDLNDLADYLGCGHVLLQHWLAHARDDQAQAYDMPRAIAARLRRFVAIDAERINLGVADRAVADWVRHSRPALGGRSVLDALMDDGDAGCRQVLLWMYGQDRAEPRVIH